ncbi:APC family permease [bacterium]|nr:APC family permease [bacterium]
MNVFQLKRLLLGQPLSNQMIVHEKITKKKALAVLSSDALSSVAYATEEILIPLAAFSVAAVAWSIPIAMAIGALLLILTNSYRQTIDAYPGGGGAYIVAKENLGVRAGLVAGGALLIDYVLTVAVSVAAGVENIASAIPYLREHKEAAGLLVICLLTLFNLRGVRESATIFAIPTYFFIFSFLVLIGSGAYQLAVGGSPQGVNLIHETYTTIPLLLAVRSFASGCSALTGVEAISNGIPMFREPSQKNAKTTLVYMALILGAFFLGITILAHMYGIVPREGETAISSLARSVFGDSFFYYMIQVSTALILVLAANTAYAGFPRLASLLAKDRFLPRQMAVLGDRLVFSNGILGLSLVAAFLIVMFEGDTHHLIPLYAVGVFLSFTLSQAGMVRYHLREREPKWFQSLIFNGLGAITTFIVLIVVAVFRFSHGAWMVVLLIPAMVLFFTRIHKHYLTVAKELSLVGQNPPGKLTPLKHTVIIPISGIHRGVLDALRYGMSISNDVRACYVELDPEATERLKGEWTKWANEIPLVVLKSPYRSVITPLIHYINDISTITKDDLITVVIPEFVTARWWHQFLHNQTALFIRTALLFNRGKVITSVRYHLRES